MSSSPLGAAGRSRCEGPGPSCRPPVPPTTSRDPGTAGLITGDGPVVAAFTAIGWGWGGTWSSGKDYQHFSATGR